MPHPAVRLVAISEEPLSVADVLDSLEDGTAGGLVLFVGRVRDHDHGQGVTGLSYSAHPSALGRLQEVCDRVAGEYDVAPGTDIWSAVGNGAASGAAYGYISGT